MLGQRWPDSLLSEIYASDLIRLLPNSFSASAESRRNLGIEGIAMFPGAFSGLSLAGVERGTAG
jgi:hypothetical protein